MKRLLLDFRRFAIENDNDYENEKENENDYAALKLPTPHSPLPTLHSPLSTLH